MAKFCSNCGSELLEGADIYLKCGKLINRMEIPNFEERKSKLIAGLLALYIGGIGIHNFYLGNNMKGIIHLSIILIRYFHFRHNYFWICSVGICRSNLYFHKKRSSRLLWQSIKKLDADITYIYKIN